MASHIADVVTRLKAALEPDDVVIGGGNAKLLTRLPCGVRLGANANAFLGGYVADVNIAAVRVDGFAGN